MRKNQESTDRHIGHNVTFEGEVDSPHCYRYKCEDCQERFMTWAPRKENKKMTEI